jgi:aspartyl/asparaginyl-tRNA synthetase
MIEVLFAIKYGWLEILEAAEKMIIYLVKSLQEHEKYQSLVAQAHRLYPLAGAFKLGLDEQGRLPRITFKQAKKILHNLGSTTPNTEDLT